MNGVNDWVEKLELLPHPEGGYYKETYRSSENIDRSALPERFSGDRSFSTAIYYLLSGSDFSAFHRIQQDEVWHYYAGDSITLHIISAEGVYSQEKLGVKLDQGEQPQRVVKAGDYFAAEVNDKSSFVLAGCTVAPGFDFADFEMPEKAELIERFPEHKDVIARLSR